MKHIKNKAIAIIGGGPGGLTLARLLQMKGADVKVYERDVNRFVREQGATLDLHEESGLKALQEAGLMDEFHAHYRPGADMMLVADQHAKVLWKEEPQENPVNQRPEIDRGPLRKILLDSLEDGTVIWDSQISSLSRAGSGWCLRFQSGGEAYADLVIAADGANSKIRPLLTPIKAVYSGVTIVEGIVSNSAVKSPRCHELVDGGKVCALGDNKSLILSAKGDGSLYFYVGRKMEEGWFRSRGIDFSRPSDVLNWIKAEFSDWSPLWSELFENSSQFVLRPQYCMPFDQDWEAQENLTMLGDAAHVMPPYAGEGVNMAMLDALELSLWLTRDDTASLQDAIASYEMQMRTRTSEVARMTMEQTEKFHSPNAAQHLMAVLRGE